MKHSLDRAVNSLYDLFIRLGTTGKFNWRFYKLCFKRGHVIKDLFYQRARDDARNVSHKINTLILILLKAIGRLV